MTTIQNVDVTSLLQHIASTLQGRNDILERERIFFEEYLKNPQSCTLLLECAINSTQPQLRQQSYIFLRQSILNHWNLFQESQKNSFVITLLQRLVPETQEPVLRSIANIISTVHKLKNPPTNLDESYKFLVQFLTTEGGNGPTSSQIQIGLVLFAELLDGFISRHFDITPVLLVVYKKLTESNLTLAKAALKVVREYLPRCNSSAERDKMSKLFNPILNTI